MDRVWSLDVCCSVFLFLWAGSNAKRHRGAHPPNQGTLIYRVALSLWSTQQAALERWAEMVRLSPIDIHSAQIKIRVQLLQPSCFGAWWLQELVEKTRETRKAVRCWCRSRRTTVSLTRPRLMLLVHR